MTGLARLTLILSAVHFLAVVVSFLAFGLGLEGNRHVGHLVLWMLLQPGSLIPGPWLLVLSLNSVLWGGAGAVVFRIVGLIYRTQDGLE